METNTDTRTAKAIARRNLDRADDALADALLRKDVRGTGIHDHPAWMNVYYGRTAKNVAAFRKALPAVAAMIEAELDATLTALAAYEVARKADKAALEARRTVRAAKAAEKAVNPARPLASVNPVAAANYDILSVAFAGARAEYIEHFTTLWIDQANRRLAGKVQDNLNVAWETKQAVYTGGYEFDSYLAKLANKITSTITAGHLVGRLWSGSTLTVQTVSGEQVWKTQCIINFSVLRKAFNQWPTRRVS